MSDCGDILAWEEAITLLSTDSSSIGPAGRNLRQRAAARLVDRLDRYFSGHSLPRTEAAAMAMIRSVAADLHTAGQALLVAAKALKEAGKGHAASQAHQAGQQATRAAQELVGA